MNETKHYWRKSSRKIFFGQRFKSAFANTPHHGFCNHFADAIVDVRQGKNGQYYTDPTEV